MTNRTISITVTVVLTLFVWGMFKITSLVYKCEAQDEEIKDLKSQIILCDSVNMINASNHVEWCDSLDKYYLVKKDRK